MDKFIQLNTITILILLVLPLAVPAHHTDTHFGDTTKHKIVYQISEVDPEYIEHVLFSAGALLRKYGDDIHIVITTFGPGIHLLGKNPGRYIKPIHQKRVSSLTSYGVDFHACGNTMDSLGWKKKDLLKDAIVVQIGVDDVMKLQEQGYSYIRW